MNADMSSSLSGTGQSELMRSPRGDSRCVIACNTIMSAVTVAGILLLLGGAAACYLGFREGAFFVFNSWLLWPLGAIACGLVVLVAAVRNG